MPRVSLTQDFLNRLPEFVPPSGAAHFFDAEIKGFVLELRASGGATFYFRYRHQGKVRFERIGRLDEMPLADARAKAYQMRALLDAGGDPGLEKRRFDDPPTLQAFVEERYLPYARQRKRSWATDATMLRHHILPAFGAWRMDRIRRADVIAWHQRLKEQGYAAGTCNRALVLLKFIYNCAIRWEVLPKDANPCVGVELFEDHGARERYLSAEEAQRLLAVIEKNRNTQVGQIIQLLLYTGARKRELLDARWEEIDFERRILTIPASRSKSKKTHVVPLSDAALAILRQIRAARQEDCPWVFVNPATGKPPVSIFYAWDSIRKQAGLPEVRLHDLRHSFASFLINAGRSLFEVQKLLGHYDPKVTMRYAHLSPQAMLEAVNVVGRAVQRPSNAQAPGPAGAGPAEPGA
ncbi:site-specific integrase [Tepidimonas charontis]|uniref:Prophage integrase IntS n=1 Tax=Tepidimonas charontis TaxID=2267262 RepID=A0A554X213_9BURK|nr:site-specific integrase [Tepidimonas charontis]TSE29872.1 Prophage integrase IntS [Tepidimonas charontis]